MALNAHAHQPVRDIPRVSLDRHLSSRDALPTARPRAYRSRPIVGGTFTDAEVALDFTAHQNPDAVFPEQLRSAIVYAARNEPERIPTPWMRVLIQDIRADCAEYLDMHDVDCHRCKRAVFVLTTSDPCPCGIKHADLAQAMKVLHASGLVR